MQNNALFEILNQININADTIDLFRENNLFTEYLLDHKYILRISESELPELKKTDRIKSLSHVSKLRSSSLNIVCGCQYHCLLFDYIQGDELWSVASSLTDQSQHTIGMEIAHFLNELHSITDDYYDVGHYVPTVPRFNSTWKNGHLEYVKILRNNLTNADFELSRLFDWCIYPESYLTQTNHLSTLLKTVIENLQPILAIPQIEKRITIYQLEHELNQLIWNGKKQEKERAIRMNVWLDGRVDAFFTQAACTRYQ